MKDILLEISYLKNYYNALNHIKRKWHKNENLDEKIIKQKAEEISSSIKQFLEYYDAAKNVTLTTKPLLIYYGFLNLARALTVFTNKDIYLKDIKYHGLILISAENSKPEEEKIEVRNGLFPLLNTFSNISHGTQFTLKELLSIFPECPETFYKYFGETIKCFEAKFIHGYSGGGHFILSVSLSKSQIEEIFPDLHKYFRIRISQKHDETILENKSEYKYPIDIPLFTPSYLVQPIHLQKIEPISSSFAIMFLLGSLVRYRPVTWNSIIIGEETGIGYVLEDYLSSCYQKFPEYVYPKLFC